MSYPQGRSYKRSLYKGYSKREGFIDEQLNNLLLSRKAYIGSLTKRINKITFLLNDEYNKNSAIDENKKLDVTVSHIRGITSITKVNKSLEICTEQEFRVIQIKNSINSFLIENFPEEELISLNSRPSSETSNSIVASVPENLQSSLDVSVYIKPYKHFYS